MDNERSDDEAEENLIIDDNDDDDDDDNDDIIGEEETVVAAVVTAASTATATNTSAATDCQSTNILATPGPNNVVKQQEQRPRDIFKNSIRQDIVSAENNKSGTGSAWKKKPHITSQQKLQEVKSEVVTTLKEFLSPFVEAFNGGGNTSNNNNNNTSTTINNNRNNNNNDTDVHNNNMMSKEQNIQSVVKYIMGSKLKAAHPTKTITFIINEIRKDPMYALIILSMDSDEDRINYIEETFINNLEE